MVTLDPINSRDHLGRRQSLPRDINCAVDAGKNYLVPQIFKQFERDEREP